MCPRLIAVCADVYQIYKNGHEDVECRQNSFFFFFSVSKIIAETLDSETLEFLGSEDKINNQDCMLAVYYADTSHSFCLHFSSSVTEVLYVDIVACEKETFVGVV